MIYVVSGYMRTGTSMMMKALESGGLDACYRQSQDDMKSHFSDDHYDPNIGGLYELELRDYRGQEFPRKFEGKLIKSLNQGVPKMVVMPDGIRVVFMRRDTAEIRRSYFAFFGNHLNLGKEFADTMETTKETILNRRDVISFHEFWYREVIERPLEHFEILRDAGWPIDPVLAAEIIDPQYCRFRLENLTI